MSEQLITVDCQVNGKTTRFHYRENSGSDWEVIEQIFKNGEYQFDMLAQGQAINQFYEDKICSTKKALIIDAGANIGASVVFFGSYYPQSLIYAIEPEENNCQLLNLNTVDFNVRIFEGAIDCEDGYLYLQDPGLSDWGFRVSETGNLKVPTISPDTVLNELKDEKIFPFIFKIDIEGWESSLFKKNLEWMDLFPLIIIELHDWMLPFQGSSKNFIKAIADREFDIAYIGENLFCFNRDLLVT